MTDLKVTIVEQHLDDDGNLVATVELPDNAFWFEESWNQAYSQWHAREKERVGALPPEPKRRWWQL